MKRNACFLLALFLVMSSAYAGFTFSFGPHEPLYNPTTLDPYGFDGSRLKVFYMTDSNHMGNNIMIHDGSKQPGQEGYYRIVDYRDFNDDFRLMLNLRMALGTSVLRFGWPEWFLADFVVQGSLNTVFVLAGGTDNLGFDGSIFAGGEVRLFDMFSLKAGIRHYSGHTGDEIIGDAMDDVGHTNWGVVDYVRDNMLEFSLGYDGIEYFDIWCSCHSLECGGHHISISRTGSTRREAILHTHLTGILESGQSEDHTAMATAPTSSSWTPMSAIPSSTNMRSTDLSR